MVELVDEQALGDRARGTLVGARLPLPKRAETRRLGGPQRLIESERVERREQAIVSPRARGQLRQPSQRVQITHVARQKGRHDLQSIVHTAIRLGEVEKREVRVARGRPLARRERQQGRSCPFPVASRASAFGHEHAQQAIGGVGSGRGFERLRVLTQPGVDAVRSVRAPACSGRA